MGRRRRIEVPGGYYHVHSRGNDRQAISFGRWSGRLFVRELERASLRHGWRIFAYCLMTNHYHVVLQIGDAGISAGMCELNGRFAIKTNATIKRTNHLFGQRFRSHLLETEGHLFESVRYTLLNPVRARQIVDPARWRFSSMRPTLRLEPSPSFLDVEWILSHFADDEKRAAAVFRRFVTDGIGTPPPTVPGTGGSAPRLRADH